MMSTTFSGPEQMQRFSDPETSAAGIREAEPVESPNLEDAEEEEFAMLWASDRGNQGA